MRQTACLALHLWRHPSASGAHGRCIGVTDLPVDRRKAKRLAHRIRQQARRHGWPHEVHSSSLQRCARVGRILRSWGWRHHVHPDWRELDFGRWEGRRWADIPRAEVDAWVADFAHHAPGGGESLQAMTQRLAALLDHLADRAGRLASGSPPTSPTSHVAAPPTLLLIAHAGVMQLLSWCQRSGGLPTSDDRNAWPRAAAWPAPPRHLASCDLDWPVLPRPHQ